MTWRHWDQAPLPADVDRRIIAEAERFIAPLAEPIEPVVLLTAIERLRLHYPAAAVVNETQAELRHGDWIEDFDGYPESLFLEACRRWRNSAERWAPTAGQLKALMQDDHSALRAVVERIEKAKTALKPRLTAS